MCHGLFIELIADIKKPTVKVGFSWDFWHESSLIEYVTT
ncbi:hypothetical protein ECDEC8A_2781 [Escherichia coli DEC8A]|nr:hypothetical protein ECDEC8A_2781 [Escherichia coli DEC8A]